MTDTLTRFVFEHAAVRGALVTVPDTVRAVLACHPYPPPLQRVLAELVAATTLLASTLKFTGSLIMQLQGDGPVRLLVVECSVAGPFLVQLRADGSPDEALGPGGIVRFAPPCAPVVAETPGGALIVPGRSGLRRIGADGSVDRDFSTPRTSLTTPGALAVAPDGRILTAGTISLGPGRRGIEVRRFR